MHRLIALYIFVITAVSTLVCCQANRLVPFNKIVAGTYQYYRNDSIQLSVDYFGDYKFVRAINSRDLKPFKKFLEPTFGKVFVRSNTLYVCTTDEPYFTSAAWVVTPSPALLDSLRTFSEIENYYERIDSVGQQQLCRQRIYSHRNYFVVFVGLTSLQEQPKAVQWSALKNSAQHEYDEIFGSIRLGHAYRDNPPNNERE